MLFTKAENAYMVLGTYFGIYCLLSGLVKGYYTYKFLKENEDIFALYLIISISLIIKDVI